MKTRNYKLRTGLMSLIIAGLLPASVFSQEQVPAQEQPLEELEVIQVTGTYIPVSADATAVPITVVTSKDLETSAVTTNALEVLRKSVPQFQGNANIGSNNANISSSGTGGGSQASLRNLTTLTLINGRRAAVSPISGTGGNQFVDLNIIPLAAIDQLQILLDGASATYGSDATSGVLNILTKKDYEGANLSSYYEFSDNDGNWENRGMNFVVGSNNGKTSITVAGGYSRQDPLWQFERGFSAVSYGTPTFGGVINIGSNYFVMNPAFDVPPVGETKPTVAFPMTTSPVAPGGKAYFGAVGDANAIYWGKKNSTNQIVGFGAGELAGASSPEAEQVAFNLARYVTLLQRRESYGAILTFDHKATEKISLFGDIILSSIETFSQINAQPVGTTPSFNVTGAHVDNPFNATVRVRNRFVENARQYMYDTTFARGVVGLKGDISEDLSFETAINYNLSQLEYKNPGVIDSNGLLSAAGINPLAATTADRTLNMFQRSVPSATVAAANFVGVAFNEFESQLNTWDGRMLYEGIELDAGTMPIVVGVEYREERLSGEADLNSIPDAFGNIKWTGATSVNPFSASRDVTSAFVEVKVPLTSPEQDIKGLYTLELGLAGRFDDYSDTSDPLVPKFTFRYLPFNDEFALRGSYSESFNAPTLYYLFGPSDVGFTSPVTLLPFGADGDDPNSYVEGQAQLRGGSNVDLEPAESEAYSFGVVYSPRNIKGLSIEATYWKIEETNIVGVISSQSILQDVEDNGANSEFVKGGPNYVEGSKYDVRVEGFGASGDPITAPGQVANNIDSIYIERPLVNIASQEASGVDLKVSYDWNMENIGFFEVASTFAYWIDYLFEGTQLAGRATLTGGTIPRWANYTNLQYTRGGINSFLGVRYIPSVHAPDEFSGKTEAEAYLSFDLGVSYDFTESSIKMLEGLEISLAVNNLTNEMPPYLPDTFSESNVDIGTYDPRGRTFIVSANYTF